MNLCDLSLNQLLKNLLSLIKDIFFAVESPEFATSMIQFIDTGCNF